MKFNEKIEALKSRAKERITPESSQEDIDRVNSISIELDDLMKDYDKIATENAKFRDTIVNMVLQNGDDKPPVDATGGHTPKSLEECLAEIQKQSK